MNTAATWAAGCVVLMLLFPQGGVMASERTSAPESGTFQGEIYVQSVSGSGCLDKAGYVFVASLSFPGLGGTSYVLRGLETGDNAAFVSIQSLTVKSGKGTTTPSGDLTWTGAGVGGSWSETGTFSGTVTEIGTHAFVLQLTEKYSSCTENLNIPLARIGVNQ